MKILIIGQAPAFQKQQYPYDTTMLYEWLNECGVSKEQAQDLFEFEALSDKFPGFHNNGGHLKPSSSDVEKHWATLEEKLQLSDKVLILGKIASEYYHSKPRTWSCNMRELELPHPSKRNSALYQNNKSDILGRLKTFLA